MGKDKILEGLPQRRRAAKSKERPDRAMAMDDELLIPLQKEEEKATFSTVVTKTPRFTISTLAFSVLGAILLTLQGFFNIRLPSPLVDVYPGLETLQYGFQLPFAVFLGALLGRFLGPLTVSMFVVTGLLFLPVFASGGGLGYISQPGFGYLIGMIAGAYVAGRLFKQLFARFSSSSLNFLAVMLLAVGTVHAIGTLYLGGLMLTGHLTTSEMESWMLHLSGEPILYDFIVTLLLLLLVRPLRAFLWLALY